MTGGGKSRKRGNVSYRLIEKIKKTGVPQSGQVPDAGSRPTGKGLLSHGTWMDAYEADRRRPKDKEGNYLDEEE